MQHSPPSCQWEERARKKPELSGNAQGAINPQLSARLIQTLDEGSVFSLLPL
ncbi:hypothetical protein [Ktedonobacter robiniae]|uniref:hypothetical protein n=1 Tax=Ktedonobacter robiniae TaxID=2778365 RepID=UPI0019163100|nr:hypothetical protein [Ktedonobacter robiniae]